MTILGSATGYSLLQYHLTRRERERLREETRKSIERELLSPTSYVNSYFADGQCASSFDQSVMLVRESWNMLKPNNVEVAAHLMYKLLRQNDPSTQDVFNIALDWSAQERIFSIMMNNLLTHLDDHKTLQEMLLRLGKKHRFLGVKPQHYLSMERAIIEAMETVLGNRWSTEHAEAWSLIFNFISHVMLKSAYEEMATTGEEGGADESNPGISSAAPSEQVLLGGLKPIEETDQKQQNGVEEQLRSRYSSSYAATVAH